jgi:hypothetical protein
MPKRTGIRYAEELEAEAVPLENTASQGGSSDRGEREGLTTELRRLPREKQSCPRGQRNSEKAGEPLPSLLRKGKHMTRRYINVSTESGRAKLLRILESSNVKTGE